MYAIIRTGGKQAKVREGDVIDVERLRAEGEVTFIPLLVVDDAGTVFSHRDVLKGARVVARVVGDSSGPKVDLFKYKAKTGYRRHLGHRQHYTALEVTHIEGPEGAERRDPTPKKAVARPVPVAEQPAAKAATPKPEAAASKAATPKPKAATPKPKAAASKAAAKKKES
ncbi:MAG: 50S ribosomal protein L21 [Actinomycetota bacterium]